MSTMSRRSRALSLALAAALAVATPLALSGCGIIEGVIEDQTGADVDLGGNEVPDDFPEEVPLIEGEVLFGATAGGDAEKIWNVTIKAGEGALEQITTQLEGAGFSATPVSETGEGSAITFTKDNLNVFVVVGPGDADGSVVNYTVTRTSSS